MIHRQCELSADHIVFGSEVFDAIEAEVVGDAGVNFIDMNRTKLSVLAGITKVKSKLLSHGLHSHGVRALGTSVHARPGATPKRPGAKEFEPDECDGDNDGHACSTGKTSGLLIGAGVKLPNKCGQRKLRCEEDDADVDQGPVQLSIEHRRV